MARRARRSQPPPPLLPAHPTLENYRELFTRLDLGLYALNSLFLSTTITAFSVIFNSMAGYAFAKLRFRGRDRIFDVVLAATLIRMRIGVREDA